MRRLDGARFEGVPHGLGKEAQRDPGPARVEGISLRYYGQLAESRAAEILASAEISEALRDAVRALAGQAVVGEAQPWRRGVENRDQQQAHGQRANRGLVPKGDALLTGAARRAGLFRAVNG